MLKFTRYIIDNVYCTRRIERAIDIIYVTMIVIPLQRAFRRRQLKTD